MVHYKRLVPINQEANFVVKVELSKKTKTCLVDFHFKSLYFVLDYI